MTNLRPFVVTAPMLAHDVPLRPGLLVRLILPIDLTSADADRLAEIVRSLAFPAPTDTTGAGT